MALGMTPEEYWHGHPRLCEAYREAAEQRRRNEYLAEWRTGAYAYRAALAAVDQALNGKKSEAEYPEEPLFATPRQAREAEEERQRREMARHRAQLRAWAASFNAAFEQRRREGAAGRGRDDG